MGRAYWDKRKIFSLGREGDDYSYGRSVEGRQIHLYRLGVGRLTALGKNKKRGKRKKNGAYRGSHVPGA